MALGLKRGVVELYRHDPKWETFANAVIEQLWCIFGIVAKDIQHVGSTAIKGIKAKPIIDIAVAVEDLAEVDTFMPQLYEAGFFRSKLHAIENDILICDGGENGDTRSYHIHIVKLGGNRWNNYLNFRDYLNAVSNAAKEYERVKLNLAKEHPFDRNTYTSGKDNIISRLLIEAQTWAVLHDIPKFESFKQIEPIAKGMSSDKKYCIETYDRKKFLLRIADITQYIRKKTEYEIMQKAVSLNIPMSEPVGFGVCNGGKNVYTLLTWVDGRELESILPNLSEKEQYLLGIKSGEILRNIHKISAPKDAEDWSVRYFKVIDERLDAFFKEGIPFDGDAYILSFLEANRNLLSGRPQCRHHGDYHTGNMILSAENTLSIIDWHTVDFENYGDPWIELAHDNGSPYFTSGQINGYFKNNPPKEFWVLFAYYFASSAITSIVWAKYFAPEMLSSILKLNTDVLSWFDNMKNPVPIWYFKDLSFQWEFGASDKLKEPLSFGISAHCNLLDKNAFNQGNKSIDEIYIKIASEKDLNQILDIDPFRRTGSVFNAIKSGECYIAVHGGIIKGFAIMNYSFFDNGFISLLIVAEDCRNFGIGTALLNYLFAKCKTEKLFTSTNKSNVPMKKLLSKAGFIFCGEIDALDEGDLELFFFKNRADK